MKTAITKFSASLPGGVVALAALPALADSGFALSPYELDALIWMLLGAGAAVVGHQIYSRLPQREHLPRPKPMFKPASAAPVRPAPAEPEQNEDQPDARSMQSWINLDEATTVTVGELSRVEEEAEAFVMMGRPDVAIRVLRDYLDFETDSRIPVWFKLLDIYHGQGMREKFENHAQEIRARFNVALPTWEDSSAMAESRHGLEHFPSLLERITLHWADSSGLAFMQELMRDNRHGERSGFHEEAFRDMLMLYEVLEIKLNECEELV